MTALDLTLPTPAENLALDEALLDACESGEQDEVLRFWEPAEYFVVVGYANKVDLEVNRKACEERNIPILRRCSGGGTVLQGPGCLNYSLVLRIDRTPALATIPETNVYVMERQRQALSPLLGGRVAVMGHTDLAIDGLKFSGNAQRRKRHALIFHGTFLLNFDLHLVESLLPMPSKEPDYRQQRSHQDFLTNLGLWPESVKSTLKATWQASEKPLKLPSINQLLTERYLRHEWHLKF